MSSTTQEELEKFWAASGIVAGILAEGARIPLRRNGKRKKLIFTRGEPVRLTVH
jgi:hypothetical protein